MKSRYEIRVFNATLVLALYVFIGMYSCAHAQAIQRICQRGYEMSYGFHDFKPRLIDDQRTKLSPGARGISLGGYCGNNLLKIRLRGVGFYEANKIFKENYYQYEAEVLSNFSPLEFFRVSKHVIDIYFITGLSYTRINLDKYASVSEKKGFDRLSRVAGVGIEYILRNGKKTVSFFSDATVANHLTESRAKDGYSPFPSVQSAINFGVRIGFNRHIKLRAGF